MIFNSKLKPNNDDYNHVFKIIAGAGWNSINGKGIVKEKVENMLEKNRSDFYYDKKNGVFLVRLTKNT